MATGGVVGLLSNFRLCSVHTEPGSDMTTIRYSFRPSVFSDETVVVINETGVTLREESGSDRRIAWSDIDEVHLEPNTAGDDKQARWLLRLHPRSGKPIQIDSVNVRGAADFKHKTKEFLAVLDAVHSALKPRGNAVRFRLGVRRWIILAWQIALVLLLVVGIFAAVVAIATEQYDVLMSVGVLVAFALIGLLMLKGKSGPRDYDPADFIAARQPSD